MAVRVENKNTLVPKINKYLVFNTIKRHPPISVDEIVRRLDISKPTVMKIVKSLMADQYIEMCGKGVSQGGRRPELYRINTASRYCIGVDFEIPGVSIASIDLGDNIIEKQNFTIDVENSGDSIYQRLLKALDTVKENSSSENRKLIGIGISISGFFDQEKGISLSTPRIKDWKNVDLAGQLEKKYGVPVRLVNDTDGKALFEIENSSLENLENVLYIATNEGLGASIFHKGHLVSGRLGNAGSISHMCVQINGRQCICGNKGCLETYASEKGIIRSVVERVENNPDSDIDVSNLNSAEIYRLYRQGNPIVTEVMNEVAGYLGMAIGNLITILECNPVIIGGEIVAAGDIFLDVLRREVSKHLQDILDKDCEIRFASEEDKDVGVRGAVIPLQREFFKGPELKVVSSSVGVIQHI